MVAYHLNLEYLLAEAYSCWAYGTGIPASLRGGGPPSIGCQKLNFQDPFVKVRCLSPTLVLCLRRLQEAMPPLDVSSAAHGAPVIPAHLARQSH